MKPSVTAAINASHTCVTELRSCGMENSYRAWTYSRFDRGYDAWVETPHTWHFQAVQSRRLAVVQAALDWVCREFDLAPTFGQDAILQEIWAGPPADCRHAATVRAVLKALLPRLIPA